MRTLIIFLLSVQFLSCSQSKKPLGCERFQTDKYFFVIKPQGVRIDINRTNDHQTEYNPVTDTLTGYNIKWTSPCDYEVFKTYRTKKTITDDTSQMRAVLDLNNIVLVKFRITETSNDYYVFESWKEGLDFVYMDTLLITK